MKPPTVNRWPVRLQVFATVLLVSAMINALFNGYPPYTYAVVPVVAVLSIVAWRLAVRNRAEVVRYQQAVHREMRARLVGEWREDVPR